MIQLVNVDDLGNMDILIIDPAKKGFIAWSVNRWRRARTFVK